MTQTALTISEFCDLIRAFMSEETIARYETYPSSSSIRLDGVIISLQRYARYNTDIPASYALTADGIAWAVNSGRVNGATHIALKAMHIDMLLMLIYAVHEHCSVMSEIPAYLMGLNL
jgi:hypothetical protein